MDFFKINSITVYKPFDKMIKKSSKTSNSNKNYSHLELVNLGKIFFKEKKFLDFRAKGINGGFEAIKDIN